MNNRSPHRIPSAIDELASFETHDDAGDVHDARTAIAVLPDSFLDNLRRGKAEEPTTSRYKVLPESDLVASDPETVPPPVQPTSADRVRELNATISAALAAPPLDMTPFLIRSSPTLPEPISVIPLPLPVAVASVHPSRTPPAMEPRWIRLSLTGVFIVVILSWALTVFLALRRIF